MKSARKAKNKLHKACKRAPEIHERTLHRQEQNRMHMASMRESEAVINSSQHRSTITCTSAPRVWHFSAFHYFCNVLITLQTEKNYQSVIKTLQICRLYHCPRSSLYIKTDKLQYSTFCLSNSICYTTDLVIC